MNRYQFRAWDQECKKMTYFDFDLLSSEGRDFYMKSIVNSNKMQCTDFKDRNGKLIYEGDIYALHTGCSPSKSSIFYVGEVVFEDVGFSHEKILSKRKYCYRYNFNYYGKVSILGNAYENPELKEVSYYA